MVTAGAALAIVAFGPLAPPGSAAVPADSMVAAHRYVREVEAWRQKRLERLQADDGWLTVVGLHWLKAGPTSFGAAAGNDLILPGAGTPARAGVLTLDAATGRVTVEAAAGATLGLRGKPVTRAVLTTDAGGRAPDILTLGAVTLQIIDRGGRLGVRVKDAHSEARRSFRGLKWYPIKPELRVRARLIRHTKPTTLSVPSIIGVTEAMPSPGVVELQLDGKPQRLTPVLEPGEHRLFFIFRDATSGRTTYGAGRFLYADPPARDDGEMVLDFNEAYSPPCAFTAYATCPMPPPENRLSVPVEAGELAPPH
jgi:uncharacterized protein (DUF1684 family)